jgi:hypothetical protein
MRLVLPVGEHRVALSNKQRGLRRKLTVEIRINQTNRVSSW